MIDQEYLYHESLIYDAYREDDRTQNLYFTLPSNIIPPCPDDVVALF